MSHPVSLTSGAASEVGVLSWTIEPAVVVPVVIAATLYLRGWATLTRRMPERFGRGRLIAMMAGLGPSSSRSAHPRRAGTSSCWLT